MLDTTAFSIVTNWPDRASGIPIPAATGRRVGQ